MIDWSREDAIKNGATAYSRGRSARVARQEEIVVRLDIVGADELALKARELLVRFHEFMVFSAGAPQPFGTETVRKPPASN